MAIDPELKKFVRSLRRLDTTDVKALIERTHPEYAEMVGHWNFCEATFKGGREWFDKNIFRYIKEGDKEYLDRVKRAYRFPHTRETVSLTNKYIFKGKIVRNEADATAEVKAFWQASTLQRRKIEDYMPLVAERASVFGRVWVVVDSNADGDDATLLAAKENGDRVYSYTVRPQDVLDLARDEDGELSWIKIRETHRDDATVLSSGTVTKRYRFWTRQFWTLFEQSSNEKNEPVYNLIDFGAHNLGRVPVFAVDHTPSECPYTAQGLIDDIAYLDRAVANYLSNLDAIIQDQAFSQLVMPHQALLPGDDEREKFLELGTKRIFTYDGQATVPPQYISPDAAQAGMILAVIAKIINEIYHSIGMSGERTKEDNSLGIDNSSGVAKAYDFERLNAMLAAKARSLQSAENTLCELVDTWYGATITPGSYDLVTYPESFDVRGLVDELQLGMQLQLLGAPDEVRRQQMIVIVDKLFPHLGADLIKKIKAELDQWPPEPPATSSPTGQTPFADNQQGQNNTGSVAEKLKSQANGSGN